MRSLLDHLSSYAGYHRDRHNIATHFVGIPMIVVGIMALLGRPQWNLAGVSLAPASAVALGMILFYFRLDRPYGAAMVLFVGACLWAGSALASSSTVVWLAAGLGLFVLGWVIQFVGHAFEGRKPAFVDDLLGLLVGPLFIVAEWGFALGWRRSLRDQIETIAGPTRVRR